MRPLKKALQDHELIVLRIIGEWYELDLTGQNKKKCIATLVAELPNLEIPQEMMYLPPEEADAIKTLVRNGGKMPVATFTRQYGEIRQMGPGALEREEPWLDPQSHAEDLWYRGLIFKGIDREDPSVEYMFMPDEFFKMFDLATLDAQDGADGEDQTADDPIEHVEGPEDNEYDDVPTPDGLEKKKTDLKGIGKSIPAELLATLGNVQNETKEESAEPQEAKAIEEIKEEVKEKPATRKVKKVKKKAAKVKQPPKKAELDPVEEEERYVDDEDEVPPEFDEGESEEGKESGVPRVALEEKEPEPEPEWATRPLAADELEITRAETVQKEPKATSRVQVQKGVEVQKPAPAPAKKSGSKSKSSKSKPTGAGSNANLAEADAVDDFVTLLTLAQMEQLKDGQTQQVMPYLLNKDENRLNMLIAIGINLLYLKRVPDGFRPTKGAVDWLNQGREAQLQALATGWLTCSWNGLRHVPTLRCEGSNWTNDPNLPRKALLDSLILDEQWHSYVDVAQRIKRENPDFQRPNGNYDTWYIRDLATGEYVSGFDNWDLVEGRLLRYLIEAPLLWLGMADAGPEQFRLTARGALWAAEDGPVENETSESITLDDTGLLKLSPSVDRYKRFQAGRFARLQPATKGEPFAYRVTPSSLQQATDVGIGPNRVVQFLQQASADGDIPAGLKRAIERWSENGVEAMVEQTVVLKVKDPKILDILRNRPETRAFLAENLSDTAVEVMPGKWGDLCQAATQLGLLLQPDGLR